MTPLSVRPPARLSATLRDPLTHFLLIGAVLFLLAPSNPSGAVDSRDVVVTPGRIEQMAQTFQATWQRPPTADELNTLVEDHIDEEVLYREARLLGLDQDDIVIRRRLRQKMEFFSEDLALQAEPTEAELEAWLAEHPGDYRQDARLSFDQVYVSPDRRGSAAATAEAERLLAELRTLPAGSSPGTLGDPLGLQRSYDALPARDVGALFGERFVPPLEAAPVGEWTGPIESGYGLHLVRVRAREPGVVPPLADVRDEVRRDVMRDRSQRVNDEVLEQLRSQYRIAVEWPEWARAAGLGEAP